MRIPSLIFALMLTCSVGLADYSIPGRTITDAKKAKLDLVVDQKKPVTQTCDEQGENCVDDLNWNQRFWSMVNTWCTDNWKRQDQVAHNNTYETLEGNIL